MESMEGEEVTANGMALPETAKEKPQESDDVSEAASARKWHRLRRRPTGWLDRYHPSEASILMTTALLVGIGAGLGALVLSWLINSISTLSFTWLGNALGFLGTSYVIFVPAFGGLFVGPMVYFWAREAKGHGVPEVIEAVALKRGRIRPIVAVVKPLASSICIGTGGSAGRVEPIVQIGAALGSTVGQFLKLSDKQVRSLVACGAAGGIAATFNAPIAGAIFALEIILGELEVSYFGPVVISAVTASVIGRILLGDRPAFSVPPYALVSLWELLLYLVLSLLASGTAVAFTRLLYWMKDLFELWNFPEYLKPVAGGLLVGMLGWHFPQIFGVGYEAIQEKLLGQFALSTTSLLLLLKMLATALTLGSGGSGGVFAPSLFLGGMLGGAFGMIVHGWLPQITAPPGAYALVGMAAVFAGASHAPVTAIIILFEMTGDYRIILPLMLTTGVSTLAARGLNRESIYTLKLSRRGVHLERGRDVDIMQSITVGEVMSKDFTSVPASMNLEELAKEFDRTHYHSFPVLDTEGKLYGIVTIHDLERALARGSIAGLKASDIATTSPLLLTYPDQSMGEVLKRMGIRDVGRVPVVERKAPRHLLGMVWRQDIIRAYNKALLRSAENRYRVGQLQRGELDETLFTEFEVEVGSPAVGQRIKDMALPEECLIVSVRRDRKLLVAHGHTLLQAGDRVTAFATKECSLALQSHLSAPRSQA